MRFVESSDSQNLALESLELSYLLLHFLTILLALFSILVLSHSSAHQGLSARVIYVLNLFPSHQVLSELACGKFRQG